MQVNKKQIIYCDKKLNEFVTYYDMDDDCEDFKVFLGENNQVFLLKNTKKKKDYFFPNQQ
jgi:hypothetical protein